MNTKELRIGNYLTLDDKIREECFHNQIHAQNDYFKIVDLYEDGDVVLELDQESVDFEIKEIKPIPLTEDWLVKSGMELPINIDDIFDYSEAKYENPFNPFKKTSQSLIDATYDFFGLELYEDSTGFWIRILNEPTHLEHAHQLQNLYFALTGRELQYNRNPKQ